MADESGGGLTLGYVLGVLRQYARLISILVVAATFGAIAVATLLPNRYDAIATVQIDPRKKTISNMEGVVSDLKADQTTIESEVEVIRSKDVILKVIELLDLRRDPEFSGDGPYKRIVKRLGLERVFWKPKPDLELTPAKPETSIAELLAATVPDTAAPARDEVAVAFLERLRVIRLRSTTLIEVKYSASDPVKAARIANAVIEVYIKDQIDDKTRAAGQATALLEEKLSDMRRRVADAEYKVEQYKAEHSIFDAEGQVLSEKHLARLLEQTVLARNVTAEAKAKFEQAKRWISRGGSKGEIAEVLQSHTIRLLKDELGKLTRRQAELMTRYGEKHPEMLKVAAEIADSSSQLNAEVDKLVSNLKNEAEIAENREQQLAVSLGMAKENQIRAKEAVVNLNALQREAQTSRQLFEALLSRYKQTAETQDLQLADARVVERAGVPLFPAAPKRKLIVLISFVAALGAGIVLAFIIDMMAPGVSRAEDVQRALEHQHLASMPQVGGSLDEMRSVRLMLADPNGVYAEAIRALRHELDGGWPYQAPRVIMVASSMPNEGKSAIASNLAHHLALTGVRTLLIDADLRKASLTETFCGNGAHLGMRDCIEERRPVEEAIVRDQVTGLCFLPAHGHKRSQANASELLVSPMMTGMIERLRGHFDAIVIDPPPLLPVVDARILADFADQIVFTMSWRKTPKELARKALRTLGGNERKVVGVVLNQVQEHELPESGNYSRSYPVLSHGHLPKAA